MGIRTSVGVAALTLALTAWAPAAVWACASGLIGIPTTDTVGAAGWCLDFQVDGRLKGLTTEAGLVNFEMGIGDRIELGVDWDTSDGVASRDRLPFNVKWVCFKSERRGEAVAVGLWNVPRNLKTYPYVVGSKALGALRVHGGATRSEGDAGARIRAMVGADYTFTDHAQVCADYTAGSENAATAGFVWTFGPRLWILVGLQHPNGGGPTEYTVQFALCGSFHRATRLQ